MLWGGKPDELLIHCPKLMLMFVPIPLFRFSVAEITPFTEQLLTNLFNSLAIPGSSENEYIMKGAYYVPHCTAYHILSNIPHISLFT